MNDPSLASGFHVLSSTQHETLGPVTKRGMRPESNKQIPEPSALRNPSMIPIYWRFHIYTLQLMRDLYDTFKWLAEIGGGAWEGVGLMACSLSISFMNILYVHP